MLQTRSLQFSYKNGPGFQFPDFSCEKGQALLVLGRSGCGKTTLLHLLAGIQRPSSGSSILLGQTELTSLSASALDRFRGQNIGLVYQKPHFLAALSVMDNLMLPPYFGQKAIEKKAVATLADQLGIGHTLHKLPSRLSIGEQQRAGIARALANQPQLILADEPTSALDDVNCETVISVLQEQAQRQHAALVIVTHDGRLKQVIQKQIDLSING